MKHTIYTSITTTLPFVVAAAVVYLFGAFGSASWSPVDWTSNARWFCVMWSVGWGFALWARVKAEQYE